MKLYKKIITIYSFNELSPDSKFNAIESHRAFLLSVMTPENFKCGDPEYDTPAELKKVYESEYEYYSENDDPIIEDIEANDYKFFENGDLASEKDIMSMTEVI